MQFSLLLLWGGESCEWEMGSNFGLAMHVSSLEEEEEDKGAHCFRLHDTTRGETVVVGSSSARPEKGCVKTALTFPPAGGITNGQGNLLPSSSSSYLERKRDSVSLQHSQTCLCLGKKDHLQQQHLRDLGKQASATTGVHCTAGQQARRATFF